MEQSTLFLGVQSALISTCAKLPVTFKVLQRQQMAAKPTMSDAQPLFPLKRVSNTLFVYQPVVSEASSPKDNTVPKAIVLFGWTAARDSHLARYIHIYRQIFPNSAILLVKCRPTALTFLSLAKKDVQQLVAPLRQILGDNAGAAAGDKPQLLVHVFSNGGSALLSMLYDLWAETGTDENDCVLPLHVTILDSAPASKWEYDRIIASLAPGVPKGLALTLTMPLLHFLAFWKTGGFREHFGAKDELTEWSKSHNDVKRVREVRRAYLYGDRDIIIPVIDVENHAVEAGQKGYKVRKELFKDSLHVSHMRTDPERYWKVVEETWSGKAKL
jgi:Eukaryotic protein of unknown function (DUF829)